VVGRGKMPTPKAAIRKKAKCEIRRKSVAIAKAIEAGWQRREVVD